jgi:hypothetical protein
MKLENSLGSDEVKEQKTKEKPSLKETLLIETAKCFEAGKYKKSKLMADRFLRKYREDRTDLNHRLYEPFIALARKNIKEATRIAGVFRGYGYENWLDN